MRSNKDTLLRVLISSKWMGFHISQVLNLAVVQYLAVPL